MKKFFIVMLAALGLSFIASSCKQEVVNEAPETPIEEPAADADSE